MTAETTRLAVLRKAAEETSAEHILTGLVLSLGWLTHNSQGDRGIPPTRAERQVMKNYAVQAYIHLGCTDKEILSGFTGFGGPENV
jgi:hypothetical protein